VNGTFGIALAPDHGEDASTLLQRADVAMYAAKAGTGIELYTSERDEYSPRRLGLMAELRQALTEEQLLLHYQAKIDVQSGSVVGAEALLRWPHPERGLIPPAEFIPLAEHTGVIRPLTRYVLRRAALDCGRWRSAGFDIGVAVNVSARNLLDVDFVDQLPTVLTDTGLPADRLTLEITESSIMSDPARVIEVLETLSQMGVRVSIDDLGTGYSSLTLLKDLPVDEVKIDKSFVQPIEFDPGGVAIVRAVIELGATLGMAVVAEGVETSAALARLRALACPVAQGYYINRPLPLADFTGWLATRVAEAGSWPVLASVESATRFDREDFVR
jgi:predicted signal transduction protein with EAL and GGDEF domain